MYVSRRKADDASKQRAAEKTKEPLGPTKNI